MKCNNRIIVILGCFLFSSYVKAQVSDELKRLHKCYGLFTNERILESDPLWLQVKSGQKSGTEACMSVLAEGELVLNGKTVVKDGAIYRPISQKVLKKFLAFYKSQFEAPDYSPRIEGRNARTRDVIDSNQSSYHFMYSLFKRNEPYSNVVTRPYSIKAIRYTQKSNRQRSITGISKNNLFNSDMGGLSGKTACLAAGKELNASWISTGLCDAYMWAGRVSEYRYLVNNDGVTRSIAFVPDVRVPELQAKPFYPTMVETGLLVGLEPETTQNLLPYLASEVTDININTHLGGGALGDQAYLLSNVNFFGYIQDGGIKMQRRYGENVMSDFLCRKNPSVRSVDVVGEVKINSKISFRQGISCMRCHAGMDGLAAVTRNTILKGSSTGNRDGRIFFTSNFLASSNSANKNNKVLLGEMDAVPNYHLTANKGRLFYRSYDGSLINEEFEGFSALGQSIIDKNDFYACAAKKHFKFLTGIEVNLEDEGDINFPNLTSTEKKYRNQVIELGQQLKQHQSLKILIKSIIQSPTFIYPDKGV